VPYEQAYGDGFEDMERRVPNIELIKSLVGWEPTRNLSIMITDIADNLQN
jgi:UDP-glucose 4-epimerase